MNESMIAREIAEIALARAARDGLRKVRRVSGWAGAEAGPLSRASLQLHFDALTRGTPAQGAALEIKLVAAEARCDGCQGSYVPEHHERRCPHCGFTQATLLGQTGVGVEALDAE